MAVWVSWLLIGSTQVWDDYADNINGYKFLKYIKPNFPDI